MPIDVTEFNSGKIVCTVSIMNEGNQSELCKDESDHEWKPMERTHQGTHLQLKCAKCGRTKEIELFP